MPGSRSGQGAGRRGSRTVDPGARPPGRAGRCAAGATAMSMIGVRAGPLGLVVSSRGQAGRRAARRRASTPGSAHRDAVAHARRGTAVSWCAGRARKTRRSRQRRARGVEAYTRRARSRPRPRAQGLQGRDVSGRCMCSGSPGSSMKTPPVCGPGREPWSPAARVAEHLRLIGARRSRVASRSTPHGSSKPASARSPADATPGRAGRPRRTYDVRRAHLTPVAFRCRAGPLTYSSCWRIPPSPAQRTSTCGWRPARAQASPPTSAGRTGSARPSPAGAPVATRAPDCAAVRAV